MKDVKQINIQDYSYQLPDDRIAKFPLDKRDESKLLLYQNGIISESVFKHISTHLPAQSLLVFNNTKVIHARIHFQRESGAKIEVFCIEPTTHLDYQLAFASKGSCVWRCMIGNAKRWKEDVLTKQIHTPQGVVTLRAEKVAKVGELTEVNFSWDNAHFFFAEVLHYAGVLPIPPYLNRDTDQTDEERYQTIYAKVQGSVAAPTAGLHFTDEVFDSLTTQKITTTEVTLHVGAGTFKPVKADALVDHEMHEETIYVEAKVIQQLIHQVQQQLPIVVVGTTSMRTLESLYWLGVKAKMGLLNNEPRLSQWDAYDLLQQQLSPLESLNALADLLRERGLKALSASTQIIIAPGYEFKLVDALITNFHQPENTLILLIAAFVGEDWREIYEHALANQFRFLSYGDSSLLFRK